MDLIPPSRTGMSLEEIDQFEASLQAAFPTDDLHVIIDVDGRAEIWSGEIALGVKWASVDPTQLIGLPQFLNPRKLTDILYDMVLQEVQKVLDHMKEGEKDDGQGTASGSLDGGDSE